MEKYSYLGGILNQNPNNLKFATIPPGFMEDASLCLVWPIFLTLRLHNLTEESSKPAQMTLLLGENFTADNLESKNILRSNLVEHYCIWYA